MGLRQSQHGRISRSRPEHWAGGGDQARQRPRLEHEEHPRPRGAALAARRRRRRGREAATPVMAASRWPGPAAPGTSHHHGITPGAAVQPPRRKRPAGQDPLPGGGGVAIRPARSRGERPPGGDEAGSRIKAPQGQGWLLLELPADLPAGDAHPAYLKPRPQAGRPAALPRPGGGTTQRWHRSAPAGPSRASPPERATVPQW